MNTDQIVRGTCLAMCPEIERNMREKEGLLHKFETTAETAARRPKADPRKTVKRFSRSAAGTTMTDPTELRPAPVLLSTVQYLFNEIATRTDVDWRITYDFIFDRLRSVRQDAVIQRIPVRASIEILQPIVRFLVYSAQRLCDRSASEFDRKINDRHLFECITRLLILYDERDAKIANERGGEEEESVDERWSNSNRRHREEIEAMHVLLNMGELEALRRVWNLPVDLKRSRYVRLSTEISLAWCLRNYVRVCRTIGRLPPILACAATLDIQTLRRTSLRIMSSAYSNSGKVSTKFPESKLRELLLYEHRDKVRADCETFGLAFDEEEEMILFERKKNFRDTQNAATANPEAYYSAETLRDFLPGILFGLA